MAKICPQCAYYNSNIRKTCALCDTLLDKNIGNNKYIPKKVSFYDIKRKNTINSIVLVFLIIIILGILGFFVGEYFGFGYWGIIIALFISMFSSLIAFYQGKDIVLKISGAQKADIEKDKMIINIIEEIAIAAGLSPPEVYIIPTKAMNAFATGRDPQHSAIALTRGLIDKLNREELSGVIAHEMSHIKHFDIRFSMLIGVLVGTIIIISDFILRYFWFAGRGRRRNKKSSSGGGIILLILLILAILSPLLAKLIQMAASRKREILADAGAAELTRNPGALANALEKIAICPEKLKASKATQHMYIVNPLKNFSEKSKSLFSTHPPIKSRIKLLRSM